MGKLFRKIGLGVAGLAIGLLLVSCDRSEQSASEAGATRLKVAPPPAVNPAPELLATQQAFIEVSAKATPAVVNIRAERVSRRERPSPLFEEFFGEFFRQPRGESREQSLGSGFIISSDGYILTNEHVVSGAEQISVRLPDQRTFGGEVVGTDPKTDVAVIKIEDDSLPVLALGDSNRIKVGQWALAIGNPFGLDSTLTVGVISATGRANVGIEDYEDFIQTDASINPGNSGGPLLNIYGEVVGINTAIAASGQGIGFAIPVNLAKLIADQLIDKGEVTRGWLGVSIQPLDANLAESFGLDRATGALVTRVMKETPAQRAGLQRGDVLLSFNGETVRGVRELQLLVASSPVGKPVPLEIQRNGSRLTLNVILTARSEQAVAHAVDEIDRQQWLGMSLAETGQGIEVRHVVQGSIADLAGVQVGDRILAVNRQDVVTLEQLQRVRGRLPNNANLLLLVGRGDENRYLVLPGSE
ncbi:MAG: peptidase [Desulfuromonas sp.]|nr:MAG: peptidase [Desulfuromonas sp.]